MDTVGLRKVVSTQRRAARLPDHQIRSRHARGACEDGI